MLRLFYIHGFLSGPNAEKAHALRDYIEQHELTSQVYFNAPDFADTPQEAFETLCDLFAKEKAEHPHDQIVLVGSSMGGFFSTLLSQRYCLKAVLLNPCIHPHLYFKNLIGPQYNPLTERHFELTDDMLPFLKSLDDSIVVRDDLLKVFLGTDDEVLDYRKAFLKFNTCDIEIVPGADHAFTKTFKPLIPQILDFAQANEVQGC